MVIKIPLLSSGYVIAGAYADKLRRTMFAQLKDHIKNGEITAQEVARSVGELNRMLYTLLVEKLKIQKGDLVRIRINYDVKDGKIVWDRSTLKIEAFRRIPDEEIASSVEDFISKWDEIYEKGISYEITKIGDTEDGDEVYTIKLEGNEVGALITTPIDHEIFIKKGAILHPTPIVIEKLRMTVPSGSSIESVIEEIIREAQKNPRYVSPDEARKLVNYIRSRVSASPIEYEESIEEE